MSGTSIRLLTDAVINKIAAGEVVDRPASVLKELMENALDAGATQIEVAVVDGGRKLISVSDNGSGMNRDDALLCLERHATSKIQDVDDIERIHTFGFRGEALAAIAAVSRFTLTTRRHEDVSGVEVSISGGRVLDVQDAGAAPGTTMVARNLFFNVPARRKFLRSDQTELSHIRQVFLLYALSYPEVGLRLVVDEREVYRLASGASSADRLRELFGPELLPRLQTVDLAREGVRVHGFASDPTLHRGDRSEQYVFVNRRPASAPVIGFALGEAYHTLLPRGRHPVVFLWVDLDPETVDVNVHPTKKEVRFRHPGAVRDAVIDAIQHALSMTAPPPGEPVAHVQEMWTKPGAGVLRPYGETPSFPLPPYPARTESMTAGPSRLPGPVASPGAGGDEVPIMQGEGNAPWAWCRVLGQVGGLFVVMESDDGMILMDPQAAHERVLYERFLRQVQDHQVAAQGLLPPETIDLPPEDGRRVREHLDLLRDMGFGIAPFGGDTFVVDALPACFGEASAGDLLRDVAQALEEAGAQRGAQRIVIERVAQAACEAAIRGRGPLHIRELERLVADLAHTEMPYTCPRGRPTVMLTSLAELRRKFGRS